MYMIKSFQMYKNKGMLCLLNQLFSDIIHFILLGPEMTC